MKGMIWIFHLHKDFLCDRIMAPNAHYAVIVVAGPNHTVILVYMQTNCKNQLPPISCQP